jgi:uncharacterized membrane protein YjjP (DUF1212 family)
MAITPANEQLTPLRAVRFCTALGRAMHQSGSPALRLEKRLEEASNALGVPGQFFATPTAIMAQYRLPGKRRPYADMVRAQPGGVDLGRLADIERVIADLHEGTLDLDSAMQEFEVIENAPRPPLWARLLPAILISAAAAQFLGAGLAELGLAAVVGAFIGTLEELAARRGARDRLVPPASAAVAALGVAAAAHAVPGLATPLALVASLIVLVPGLEFTMAIKEIATENLVAGSARLVSAIGDFLLLAFGVALGTELAVVTVGVLPAGDPTTLPAWTTAVGLGAAALGFAMRFNTHRGDVGWVAVACLVSWAGARAGTALLGPDVGVLVAALAVGLAANARARWSGTSSMVMMIPGLILLVPGSFGLRAIDLMLHDDIVPALGTFFSMLLIATALATGLLVANLLLPSDRSAADA